MTEAKRALCLRGDEAELFRRHRERLVRLAQSDAGARLTAAEDAVSHAFEQLCRCQPERTERLEGWLRVVARHEALRLDRDRHRLVPLDAPSSERQDKQTGEQLTLADRLPTAADTELVVEARDALQALADLRWRRRRVLALKVAGFSYREIMEQLGLTYTNVNRQLVRGEKGPRSRRLGGGTQPAAVRGERTWRHESQLARLSVTVTVQSALSHSSESLGSGRAASVLPGRGWPRSRLGRQLLLV